MANILFAWEMGGGLGHLTRFQPLAVALARQGHQVVAAVRDLAHAELFFHATGVSYLQAPVKISPATNRVDPARSFAHVLHNLGYGQRRELRGMAEAWRNLLGYVRPDLIVCDHSPTALLASRFYSVKRVCLGTGFCCPAAGSPLPDWRPWLEPESERLRRDEQHVLDNMNHVLATWERAPLEQLTDLYAQVDETLLTTLPDLDHFPGRAGGTYCGIWSDEQGKQPVWPSGPGPRVFAYLKPFAAVSKLFEELVRRRLPTILFTIGLDRALKEQFSCPTLRFENEPLELDTVGQQCDLAILNAGHGTTIKLLLAGKPQLLFPLQLEQRLTADNIVALGAGLALNPKDSGPVAAGLSDLLGSPRFAQAAQQFARRYAGFDSQLKLVQARQRIEELASST